MRSMIFLAFFLSTPTFACDCSPSMSSKHQAAVLEAVGNLKELLAAPSSPLDAQSAILEACEFWK